VIETGRLSYGPFTQKFESKFAFAHDCRFATMTNSGTSSLLLALQALKTKYGWSDGDEVIVPAVTFIATSNIVLQCNMVPVFVDVDPHFYELDPTKIEEKITEKTRCVIPVHLFGSPCDMDPILDIAKINKLRVIEDSCETMFVKYKGRSVGSLGDVGCFSTYVAHILTTGVGGLNTTNDTDLAVRIRSMMNHGRDSIYISIDDDKDKTDDEMKMIIKKRFSFVQMGHSFRVTEMEGAVGLAEFENHDEMMKKRWDNGQFFIEKLESFSDYIQLPQVRPDCGHSFMMFPIVVKNESKEKLVEYLEKNGIETRDMLPLTNQPYYKELLDIKEDDYPVAKWINESGFYIGSHQGISDIEREYIVETFGDYFSKKSIRVDKSCLIILSKLDELEDSVIFSGLWDSLSGRSLDDVIVADASTHARVENFFQDLGVNVIHRPGAQKGELLLQAVESTDCENIIVMGIDGTEVIDDIDKILIKLRQGTELVIASRFMMGGERDILRPYSFHSVGNRFFTGILNVLYGRNITDCNNIFRGFKKHAIHKMSLVEKGYSIMFEMTLKSVKYGLKVSEIPTRERRELIRRKKQNRFLSAIKFTTMILKNILKPELSKKRKKEMAYEAQ